jgi:hypothetical protein
MAKNRASIFDSDELDVSEFAPRIASDPNAVPVEQVRAIAEASQFPSREVKKCPLAVSPPAAKRQPRRHRTGRTVQFNCRTTQGTVDGMYAIADQQGWLVGETLEHALAALQRELKDRSS